MDLDNSENTAVSSVSLLEYVYLIWHWAWLVALIVIVVAAATYWFNLRQTPIYESTTQLLVSDPPGTQTVSSSSLVTTINSASTYSNLITNTPVLQSVIDKLGLHKTAQSLQSAISVSVVQGTQIIAVSVRDPSPELAAKIANTIVTEFQSQIQAIQANRYQSSEGNRKTQIASLNATQAAEVDPTRQVLLQTPISQAQSSLDQITLAEAQSTTIVIQVQPAQLPTTPISPRTALNALIAAVTAALLSIGGILAIDFLDDSIKNPDELDAKFGIAVLGIIPNHKTDDGKLITISQPRNPVSEAFRALRTNIQYASVDDPVRTIIISSPTPQDGKTTLSTNLGVVLAQSGKKVILIDADMRRPQIHERFNLPNSSGLSNLFVGNLDNLAEIIQKTDAENLSVITSGHIPPNPAELLASQKMMHILEKLKETYDIIIIDTPPVLTVTDAVALSTMVDGVLLVAKPAKTKMAAFKHSLEILNRVSANILGAVINDIEPRNARYGYYYRQYYYSGTYYYDQKTGEKKKRTEAAPKLKEG